MTVESDVKKTAGVEQVLGVDIGGSGIKGAPVDVLAGEMVGERIRVDTPQPATPDAVGDVVAAIATEFDWDGPIGCTFPAVVQGGIVHSAVNVDKSWIEADAAAVFAEKCGVDVRVMNDADAAGVAEMEFGAGRGVGGVVVMVTLGTGIGTAVFTDGTLVPNTELGHIIVDGVDAETLAASRCRKEEGLTWSEWGLRVARYLRRLEDLTWPDLFIIGGGVSRRHEKFFDVVDVRTPFVAAELRNQAGIIGAATAASK